MRNCFAFRRTGWKAAGTRRQECLRHGLVPQFRHSSVPVVDAEFSRRSRGETPPTPAAETTALNLDASVLQGDGQGLSEGGGYCGGMKKKIRKVNGAKISPVQRLRAVMAARRRATAEVAELRAMLAEKTARRVELETSGDLGAGVVIGEIGKLQVLVELLPRRIAFKEQEEVKAEENLVAATNDFIREHLGPRVRCLEERTRVIVQKELSAHIRDQGALVRAVAGAERVRELARLSCASSVQPQWGAMAHAETALKAWAGADEVEKKLLAEECVAANFVES